MILFSNSPNTLSGGACFVLPEQLSCYPINANEFKHLPFFLSGVKQYRANLKGLFQFYNLYLASDIL